MKKELQFLINLQEKDISLDKLRSRAENIPKEIEALEAGLSSFKTQVEALKNNSRKLLMSKKEKEIELETKENEIKKHNMELNSIKKNDAYKTMLSEINKAKESKQKLEEEILTIMVESDNETKKVKVEEANVKSEEAKIVTIINEKKAELEKLKQEISVLENERAAFAKEIPESLCLQYEHIRDAKQGLAIVPIEGDSCGGCYITLRPQIINDVFKDHDMIYCDSCSRILYKK